MRETQSFGAVSFFVVVAEYKGNGFGIENLEIGLCEDRERWRKTIRVEAENWVEQN